MSEAATGIVILITLIVLCAAVAHAVIRRPIVAAAVAAVVASLLFQIAVTIRLGHMEPFALIAFMFGALWAFLVGVVVGLLFHLARRAS